MKKKQTMPKINKICTTYTGDSKAFDAFIESLIADYLETDDLPQDTTQIVVDNKEIVSESA